MADRGPAGADAAGLEPGLSARAAAFWEVMSPAIERYGVLVIFAAVIAAFSILSTEAFFQFSTAEIILRQTSTVILLAVGLTLVLAAGEFDLSFPAAFGLVSGVTVTVMVDGGLGPALGVLVGVGVGVTVGIVNGALVATRRASSFIITLAVGSVATGLMFGIAGEAPITFGLPEGFREISRFEILGQRTVVIAALVVAVAIAVMLRTTVFGKWVRATGSNPAAAETAGVPVSLVRIAVFAVLGLCVAIAGVSSASQANAYYPAAGQGLFLPPFVAAFLGTSVLAKRQFNVFGTVVGALFVSTLDTGLIIEGAPSWLISVIQGAILLAAVMLTRKQGLWGRNR